MRIWNELVQFFQIYDRVKTIVKMLLANWSSETRAGVIAPFLNNSSTSESTNFSSSETFLFLSEVAFGLAFLEIEFLDHSRSGEFPCRWSVLTNLIQSWLFWLPEVYFLSGVETTFLLLDLRNPNLWLIRENVLLADFSSDSKICRRRSFPSTFDRSLPFL